MINLIKIEVFKILKNKKIIVLLLSFFIINFISLLLIEKNNVNVIYNSYVIELFSILIISFLSPFIIVNDKSLNVFLTSYISRWKVFVSKLLTSLIGTFIILLIVFVSIFVVINSKINGEYIFNYIVNTIPIFFVSILSFSLGNILSSNAISSIVCILLSICGVSVTLFFLNMNYKFIQYTFLPYLDFTIFFDKVNLFLLNETYEINISLINGIIILLFYSTLFTLISLMVFIKRDK